MHLPFLLTLTLTLTLTSALPLPLPTLTSSDSRAATLHKPPHLTGSRIATDYTPIPLQKSCFDLANLYGGWSAGARSLSVERGVGCVFYTDSTCTSPSSPLCVNGDDDGTLEELPGAFDRAIRSVRCAAL